MRDELIKVKPFEFIDYLEITGSQAFGSHGTLKIIGHILAEKEQEYISLMTDETWVHVDAVTYDGVAKHVFKGIILDADIEKVGETCVLTLNLITGSFLMDTARHIRSFQDDGISYDTMLSVITEEYSNSAYKMTAGQGSTIPGFVLQYNETDWEFAKRLASHFETDIYPDSAYEGTKIYFGEPNAGAGAVINTNEYSVVKRNQESMCYVVRWRELYHLGEWLQFNGIPMWIAGIETRLDGSELYHTYHLVQKNEIKTEERYNGKCVGASLAGKVLAVEKDKVQVELDKDENKERAGKRWFLYATPYSSPDGTGWYCMPEVGDRVRLRIPSDHEAEAYVISSVHMDSADGSERQNPDFKSIMNKQGKEILLTPKSLIMTNNAGMSIEILDDEGIKIMSDKDITISAADSIEITSATSKLELYAKENLILQQGDTQLTMDGQMRVNGARLNLN